MSTDIDIDFADRSQILSLIQHVPARQIQDGKPRQHNSGVYVTDIPRDPVHRCAAIDYETAESRGYFKIDFLNVSVYQLIRDHDHYQSMLDREPPWQRLWQEPGWAAQIIHIGNYAKLLAQMRPDSIDARARPIYRLVLGLKFFSKSGTGMPAAVMCSKKHTLCLILCLWHCT